MTGSTIFQRNCLWANLQIGSNSALAIIDTGTSTSVAPRKWMIGKTIARYANVATPFSTKEWPVVKDHAIVAGVKSLNEVEFLVSKTRFPIIGNNIIFCEDDVSISTSGVNFGITRSHHAPLATIPLVFSYLKGSAQSGIKSVFFILTIGGTEQKVFFDTGRANLLTATSKFIPQNPIRKKKINIRFNPFGEWGLSYYTQSIAKLRLGSEEFEFQFRHETNDHSVDAPFVIGSSILNHFDIAMSAGEKQARFFPKGSFDFGEGAV
jgi:hypothetical protein